MIRDDIYLLYLCGFDFKLAIGKAVKEPGPGLIGDYLHRYNPGSSKILGVVPLKGINLDQLTDDDLPIAEINIPEFVPHNINEINKYLSLYKLAFQEAKKYLILR